MRDLKGLVKLIVLSVVSSVVNTLLNAVVLELLYLLVRATVAPTLPDLGLPVFVALLLAADIVRHRPASVFRVQTSVSRVTNLETLGDDVYNRTYARSSSNN